MAKDKPVEEMTLEERVIRIQERQLAIQEAQVEEAKKANAIAVKQAEQTKPKENSRPPLTSEFNPRGEKDFPRPELAFDVLAPWPMSKGKFHALTDEEVRLMNRIPAPCDFTLELLDESTVRGSVIAQKHMVTGKIEKIAFMGPRDAEAGVYTSLYSKERKSAIPSLVNVLHQILDQHNVDYSDILPMKEIKRRILLPDDHADHLAVSVGQV